MERNYDGRPEMTTHFIGQRTYSIRVQRKTAILLVKTLSPLEENPGLYDLGAKLWKNGGKSEGPLGIVGSI